MPFAYVCSLIPCFIKIMSKGRNVFRKGNTVPVASALSSIQACLQACPGRSANGLTCEIVFKFYSFACQLHKIGCNLFVNSVPSLLVAEVKYDVFLFHILLLYNLCRKALNGIEYIDNYNKGKGKTENLCNNLVSAFSVKL